MNIIIPMAGIGKRMRPHTLTVPKPLIPVGGKPIVQRLVEDLAATVDDRIEEVAFIIGPAFGKEVETRLINIAENIGAKGVIYYQEKAEGTAHAVYCAAPSLTGNVLIAFADTLFKTDYKVKTDADGIIFVQPLDDPSPFGVVKLDASGCITEFIEKPSVFVSDLTIIGIYYIKDAAWLKKEIQYLLDHNIREKGEYQLTNALEYMKRNGARFFPGKVDEWLDCGNKDATVFTNQRILELKKNKEPLISGTLKTVNSVIIEPCFIGENVVIENSVIGPHVSVGEKTRISGSVISNSIIQTHSVIQNKIIHNSMIGNFVELTGNKEDLSIGDFIIEKKC
jgi:glucose-1-phosphate thymidylyltransferase